MTNMYAIIHYHHMFIGGAVPWLRYERMETVVALCPCGLNRRAPGTGTNTYTLTDRCVYR